MDQLNGRDRRFILKQNKMQPTNIKQTKLTAVHLSYGHEEMHEMWPTLKGHDDVCFVCFCFR